MTEVMNDWELAAASQGGDMDQTPTQFEHSFQSTSRETANPGATSIIDNDTNVDENDGESQEARVIMSKKNGRFISRSHVDDYKLRPVELQDVSLYDWMQCAVRKLVNKSQNTPPLHFLYHPGHALRDSHWVHFDPKRIHSVVPTILGPYLPRKDAEDQDMYACTMLTFFVPWRSGMDLKSSVETWLEAFERFAFSDRHREIMTNMNIRYECYDARDDFHAQLKARVAARDQDDCGSGDLAEDDEDGDFVKDLDADGAYEGEKLGKWTQKKLNQMRDVETVLQSAGWVIDPAEQHAISDGPNFCPEQMLVAKKWN